MLMTLSHVHIEHASVSKITKFISSYAGLQLETEINALKKITSEIKNQFRIIGGSKISTKIGLIKNLIPKFDHIIIAEWMAIINILSYKGNPTGKSLWEKDCDKIIRDDIFKTAKITLRSIIFPEDVAVGNSINGKSTIKGIANVKNDDLILDIGPKTIKKIKDIIEISQTVLWNGPVGYFEKH